MTKNASIPDHFGKTGLTSLTISVVLFIASVADRTAIKQTQIFSVAIGSINTKFLVLSLMIAAVISVTLVVLSYINEAIPYQRLRREAFAEGVLPDEIGARIGQLESDFRQIMERLWKLREAGTIASSLQNQPVGIDPEAFKRIIVEVWTEEDETELLNLAGRVVQGLGDRQPGEYGGARGALLTLFNMNIVPRIEQRLNRLQYGEDDNLIVRGDTISRLMRNLGALGDTMEEVRLHLAHVRDDVEHYNRFLKSLNGAVVAQVTVFGLGMPAVVCAIAVLHGIGALGFAIFPSAPKVVELMLS
jgi:hypothetical protein